MEPASQLSETLQRLQKLITERGLNRSELLNPAALAAQTALCEGTVRTLLEGGTAPEDTVNDRVRSRIKTLAQARLTSTGRRMSDLAADVSQRLGISEVWARLVCDGKKVPSVDLLHGLVQFFGVEERRGEAFFTVPADEALNQALLPVLLQMEHPETDPVQALMERFGVQVTDLRHHGSMSREQLERLLEGVFRSVLPPEGEGKP